MKPGNEPPQPSRDNAGSVESEIRRFDGVLGKPEIDHIVLEEPLEIRVNWEAFATLMRTPGDDRDLALGFLYAEGVIDSRADIGALSIQGKDALVSPENSPQAEPDDSLVNTADLLPADPNREIAIPSRQGPSMSSCGICGKRSISEALRLTPPTDSQTASQPWLPPELIGELPDRLKQRQELFIRTGALHAAGIFNQEGKLLFAREDIGRHNAVDKLVGAALMKELLPLKKYVLQVSGRISFEIVQKAYRAGIPALSAVSGASSLSISLAQTIGMTLAGFVRDGKYCLYSAGSCLLNSPPRD